MSRLTPEGTKIISEIAALHGVSPDAAETLLVAVSNGHGTQAQFSHPELGGMGQWSAGGMTMVGDMFNHGLKAKVDALCTELSQVLVNDQVFAPNPHAMMPQGQSSGTSLFVAGSGSGHGAWPADLGTPSSTGAQNDMRYAIFPERRRLVVEVAGRLQVFDTADHRISGVSQQQSGDQSLTFVSQHGLVKVADLTRVDPTPDAGPPSAAAPPEKRPGTTAADEAPAPAPPRAASAPTRTEPSFPGDVPSPARSSSADEIISLIQKLSELKDKGILTEVEFEAKKSELLARL